MSLEFPEVDWGRLHQIRTHAVERFCKKALAEIIEIRNAPHTTAHDAYLKISDLVRQTDHALAVTFERPTRSNAIKQIYLMKSHGLLKADELSRFTNETQKRIEMLEK